MTYHDKVIVASQNQLASELGDEIVILNLDDGMYYGLNPLGAYVWRIIGSPQAFADIVSAILADFEVEQERCEQDLTDLLTNLEGKKLVQVSEADVAAASE